MRRFEGPVRFRFNGDPELARQYMALGRKFLGGVMEEMSRTGLPELSRIFRTQDGTTIVVRSGYGENSIDITREEVEPQIEIPPEGQGFVTVPASDDAPNGWGEPFFDGEDNPINPPLGTPGGQYPVTWLNYDTEEGDPWVAKRYPDYQNIWPTGLVYERFYWAGKRGDESIVFSFQVSDKKYDTGGFVYGTGDILFQGNRLCSPPADHIIYSVCYRAGFLVGAFERVFQGIRYGLSWHFRTFRAEGYSNDDPYDSETNPLGWRPCVGDATFPDVTIGVVIQPFSINRAATRAVVNYMVDPFAGCCQGNVWGADWTIAVTPDGLQITISVVSASQGQVPSDMDIRNYTASEQCYVESEPPPTEYEEWNIRTDRMESKGYVLTLFREFAPNGIITGQVVTLNPGVEDVFQRVDGRFIGGNPTYRREENQRTLSIACQMSMGGGSTLYSLSREVYEKTVREGAGYPLPVPLPIVESINNDTSERITLVIDCNMGLGYWLLVDNWRDESLQYNARFYVRGPDNLEHELFKFTGPQPLFLPGDDFNDATFLRVNFDLSDNPGFNPNPVGLCPQPPPGQTSQDSWNYQYNNKAATNFANEMENVSIRATPFYFEVDSDLFFDPVGDTYEYSFGAYHDGIGNEICTAWVRWVRDSVEYFGTFDYISDGNLPELTQVTGPNARHIQTGVI